MAWGETFGAAASRLVTRSWTAAERNTLNAPHEGVFLWNRLLWLGISVAILAAAYALYRPAIRGAKEGKTDKLRKMAEAAAPVVTPNRPLPAPTERFAAGWTRLASRTAFEMSLVFKSPAYVVLILLGFAFAVPTRLFIGELLGAPVLLVTRVGHERLPFGLTAVSMAIVDSAGLVCEEQRRKGRLTVHGSPAPS